MSIRGTLGAAGIAIMFALPMGAQAAPTISSSFDDDEDFTTNFTGNELAVAEARWGNNSSDIPGSGDQEILVRPGGTFSPDDQGNVDWPSEEFDYSLAFDPVTDGDASDVKMRFTAKEVSVESNYDFSTAGEIQLRVAGGDSPLTLSLEGEDVEGPAGDENYFAISGIDYTSTTTLTGTGVMDSGTAGSRPSFQFKVTDVQPVPVPATIALLGAGLVGLGFARRRRLV